jgi:hypothetical protein
MKTYRQRKDQWTSERRINPYVTEARFRERFWQEFRIEMELIGARLRRVRLTKGYSLATAAGVLKMPKRRLAMIERGVYKHFTTPDLYRMCQLYGTSTVDVLSVIPDACFDSVEFWKYRRPHDPAD